MKKKSVSWMLWMLLAGVAFFAFQLPIIIYGESPEIIDDVILPQFTPTNTPPEMELTQREFASRFFTPTYTAEPTHTDIVFLLPITGSTQTVTSTATITKTATLSATPTRTLLPIFMTQTRASGGVPPPGSTSTSTNTLAPSATNTLIPSRTMTASLIPTNTPVPTRTATLLPTRTSTSLPTRTSTPLPTRTSTPLPTQTPIPTDTDLPTLTPEPPTDTPQPPPTDTPEPPPPDTPVPPPDTPVPPPDTPEPPTDTPEPPPSGNSTTNSSASSPRYLQQFIFLYLLGATLLGVVFKAK